MDEFAAYVLAVFIPWTNSLETGIQTTFPLNTDGLAMVAQEWDSSVAPFIQRQRYRYIANFIYKGVRNASTESKMSLWRQRNADWWGKTDKNSKSIPNPGNPHITKEARDEDQDTMTFQATIDLVTQTTCVAKILPKKELAIQSLTTTYTDALAFDIDPEDLSIIQKDATYCIQLHPEGISYTDICERIAQMNYTEINTPDLGSDITNTLLQDSSAPLRATLRIYNALYSSMVVAVLESPW